MVKVKEKKRSKSKEKQVNLLNCFYCYDIAREIAFRFKHITVQNIPWRHDSNQIPLATLETDTKLINAGEDETAKWKEDDSPALPRTFQKLRLQEHSASEVPWSASSRTANVLSCYFCGRTAIHSIDSEEIHQMEMSSDSHACSKVAEEVEEKSYINLNRRQAQKFAARSGSCPDVGNCDSSDDVNHENLLQEVIPRSKRLGESNIGGSIKKMKRKDFKGPTDMILCPTSEKNTQQKKEGELKQTSINDTSDKKARDRAIEYVAKFFYEVGVPFNAARLDSFKHMVEAIGRYGPNLKPPSSHEIRVPLFKKELQYTNDLLKRQKETWVKHGCSIMLDVVKNQRESIINFLVNCSSGTMFVESIDASSYVKSGEKLFELLDSFVEDIGEKNVVQVITEGHNNFVSAGKLLEAKRGHLFWTPCAAHCINLMLEDIGELPQVKKTLERAMFLVGFIYNHTTTLNMMRHSTDRKELIKYGVTKMATNFLTLLRIHKQESELRRMFISDQWKNSKLAKEPKGKRAYNIVWNTRFWKQLMYTLRVMAPLVRVLRLASTERRPAIGYIYKAMDGAKEAISKTFNGNEEKYKDVFAIIDKRWQCQLQHPLHAAGHFLNPEFFYVNPTIFFDSELFMMSLHRCIERLIPSQDIQLKILNELFIYKEGEGLFGVPLAKRNRTTMAPAEWWRLYGHTTPNLQQLAIKILSLTCSAVGCQRNLSCFEYIHIKKRNQLEHQKLHDLVFMKYNQALIARYDRRDVIDPISLNDIDGDNEWFIGDLDAQKEETSVFGDDVTKASGTGEMGTCSRQQARRRLMSKGSTSTTTKVKKAENDLELTEEETEGYISSDCVEESFDYSDDAGENSEKEPGCEESEEDINSSEYSEESFHFDEFYL